MTRLLSTAIFLLLSICSFSQIDNNIWGFILGSSTRREVEEYMSAGKFGKRFKYPDHISYASSLGEYEFASCYWIEVNFRFVNDTLAYVQFRSPNYTSTSKTLKKFKKMRKHFNKEYGEYIILSDKEFDVNSSTYTDGATTIHLQIRGGQGNNTYYDPCLIYCDNRLFKKYQKQTESKPAP